MAQEVINTNLNSNNALLLAMEQQFGITHPVDQQKLMQFFHFEIISKGNFFQKQNQSVHRLSFIQSGYLRIFADAGDKTVTQWIASPGYFMTDLAGYMYQQPAKWSMEALSDLEVFTLFRKDYDRLHSVFPQWPQLEKLFIVHCFGTLEQRMFNHLSMTAEERYHIGLIFIPSYLTMLLYNTLRQCLA